MKLTSLKLEKNVIAGILKFPQSYFDVKALLSQEDFAANNSKVHKTIWAVLSNIIETGDCAVEPVIIAERISRLGISFEDDLRVGDYIESLSMIVIKDEKSVVDFAKELKKLSIRRSIVESAENVKNIALTAPLELSALEVVKKCDEAYNLNINKFQNIDTNRPINIYEKMEEIVEEWGNNPKDEVGPMLDGFPRMNGLFGTLWNPEDITTIVAKPAVGKTSLALDLNTRIGVKYDIPVFHMDNGEMSYKQLLARQCAALSGVPLHYIESGKWRLNEEYERRVRSQWSKIKNWKFFYLDVGGKKSQEMISEARKFYYSQVGRGNKMIISFDYIKTSFESFDNKREDQIVGEMLDRFKQFIKSEIKFNDDPMISMFTSVQQNRYGDQDDDSSVSLSHRIQQFASDMFILRRKTKEEVLAEPTDNDGVLIYGTHKLIPIKNRKLGKEVDRCVTPVKMPDGKIVQNYVNLRIKNFDVSECGDARDMADFMASPTPQ